LKTKGGLQRTRLIGHQKCAWQLLLRSAAYNFVRMGNLSGWCGRVPEIPHKAE
jgi:hypothetical protein